MPDCHGHAQRSDPPGEYRPRRRDRIRRRAASTRRHPGRVRHGPVHDPLAAAPPVTSPDTRSCRVTVAEAQCRDFTPYQVTYTPPKGCGDRWSKVVLRLDGKVGDGSSTGSATSASAVSKSSTGRNRHPLSARVDRRLVQSFPLARDSGPPRLRRQADRIRPDIPRWDPQRRPPAPRGGVRGRCSREAERLEPARRRAGVAGPPRGGRERRTRPA